MTDSDKTITTASIDNYASTYKFLGDMYSKCGLHRLAAKNYREAAFRYREAGNLEEGQNCSCAWLLSEIAA